MIGALSATLLPDWRRKLAHIVIFPVVVCVCFFYHALSGARIIHYAYPELRSGLSEYYQGIVGPVE